MIMNMVDNSKDVAEIKDLIGYTRGKNLLKNNGVGYTSNGITFTVNEDGSVTANGTPTINKAIQIYNSNFPKGEYILSGCPEGGSESTYYLDLSVGSTIIKDVGNGVKFVVDDNTNILNIRVYVVSGTVLENLTFYPMIRRASVTDDTYEPYGGDSVDSRLNSILEDLKWKEIYSFEKAVSSSTSSISLSNGTSYPTVDITPYSELMIKCKYYANNQWYHMKKDARIFVLSTDDYIGNNKSIPTPYSTSGDGSITRSSEKVFTAWNFGSSYNGATMSLKIYGRKNIL